MQARSLYTRKNFRSFAVSRFYHIDPKDNEQIEQPIFLFYYSKGTSNAYRLPLHSHEYTEIFYFTKGDGVMHYKNKVVPVKKDDLVIINSRIEHTEQSNAVPSKPKRTTYIWYNVISVGNNFPFVNDNRPTDEIFHVSYGSPKNKAKEIFKDVEKLLTDKPPYYSAQVNILLQELFLELNTRFIAQNPTSHETDDLVFVKNYIDENYDKDINLDQLSKLVYVSKTHLINKFKERYGLTPIQYLIEIRIRHAKILLRDTTKSITDIACSIGFNDSVYFSAVFRKLVGVTPSYFRKVIDREDPLLAEKAEMYKA